MHFDNSIPGFFFNIMPGNIPKNDNLGKKKFLGGLLTSNI